MMIKKKKNYFHLWIHDVDLSIIIHLIHPTLKQTSGATADKHSATTEKTLQVVVIL